MIGAPFGDPIGDKAHSVCGDAQGLARSAGGKTLFPFRNWHVGAQATDGGNDERCALKSLALLGEAFFSGGWLSGFQNIGQNN